MPTYRGMVSVILLCALAVCGSAFAQSNSLTQDVTQGALRVKAANGELVECPLRHTDVRADVSGFIARVQVTQTFYNPYDRKIEAIYVFPLPHTAAVDEMTMVIGTRRVVGVVKRREEARAIYERAVASGLTASLLEQERPNIFTQSVGNILPHQEIRIEIGYVDVLKYDLGAYEFHFPMVVGPRYVPGTAVAPAAGKTPDTDRVPDGSRLNPPVLKPGQRTGHDISLAMRINAGVPIRELTVPTHQVTEEHVIPSLALVELSPADAIPNKDFVLRYTVAGAKPEMTLLSHAEGSGKNYFMLMLHPRQLDADLAQASPRELVFLVDVSGSMSGYPTEKVKETMRQFFKLSKPDDRVQVITFANKARKLFDQPVPATDDNVAKALNFSQGLQGGGGTEMLEGVRMALAEPADPARKRIVIMLSDGYIGNEDEVMAEVGKRAGEMVKFWALGIGSAPNRYLIDGVAKHGGGMSAMIGLNADPADTVAKVVERCHRAQMSDLSLDWHGFAVSETYPAKIPDLWAGRPVVIFGRYQEGGQVNVTLAGKAEGKPLAYSLDVTLPDSEAQHAVLTKIWARKKIDDLSGKGEGANKEAIIKLALDYRLMTKYTSLVAVDEKEVKTPPVEPPKRVDVAVPLPEGVSHAAVTGKLSASDLRTGIVKTKSAMDTLDGAAATSTRYIGGGGGDPWIYVTAPADARQVVAVFPGGEVKALVFDARSQRWSVRFDFPFGTAPGRYRVGVVIVKADGTRARLSLEYENLVRCAITARGGRVLATPGAPVTVRISGSGIQRAVAVAPWGERQVMSPVGNGWQAELTVPATWAQNGSTVTVVLLDGAHNRMEISLDMELEEAVR